MRALSQIVAGNIIDEMAYSKLYPKSMRRASRLHLGCLKMVAPMINFAIAIALVATFSVAPGSAAGDRSKDTGPAARSNAQFLVMDKDTVSSPLPEGETTYVIFLARNSTLDRFTFINENKPARGELRIAVANEKLPAESDKWIPVDGAVPFNRKRLFNVSMVGVEARYVRLIFHVEREDNLAAPNTSGILALN